MILHVLKKLNCSWGTVKMISGCQGLGREGWTGRAHIVFMQKVINVNIMVYIVIIYLSKLVECTTPRLTTIKLWTLGDIMLNHHRYVYCNKHNILVAGGGCWWRELGLFGETGCTRNLCAQFCPEPKPALKMKFYFKMKLEIILNNTRNTHYTLLIIKKANFK